MNKEQLNAIKKRAEKATSGPWKVYQDEFSTRISSELIHPQLKGPAPVITEAHDVHGVIGIYISANDTDFIVHAREDVPALIAEVERLRGVLEEMACDIAENTAIALRKKRQALERK